MKNKSVNDYRVQLGIRLKRAREAQGLSLREVVGRLALGPHQLSHTELKNYEGGVRAPGSGLLIALAKIYNVKTEYFYRSISCNISEEQVCYRGRNKLTDRNLRSMKALLCDFGERVIELLGYYKELPVAENYMRNIDSNKIRTQGDIERFATKVREAWGLGINPLHDLVDSIEKMGIFIFSVKINNSDFDGFSCVINGMPFIVVNDNQAPVRRRFSIVHELGHILLKGNELSENFDVEIACNRFAAAFLFPKESAFNFIGKNRTNVNYQELRNVSEEFGISIESVLYRLSDLSVLSWDYVKKMKCKLEEEGRLRSNNEKIFMKKPRLFEQLILRGLEEEYYNMNKAAELMGKPLLEFREIMAC